MSYYIKHPMLIEKSMILRNFKFCHKKLIHICLLIIKYNSTILGNSSRTKWQNLKNSSLFSWTLMERQDIYMGKDLCNHLALLTFQMPKHRFVQKVSHQNLQKNYNNSVFKKNLEELLKDRSKAFYQIMKYPNLT